MKWQFGKTSHEYLGMDFFLLISLLLASSFHQKNLGRIRTPDAIEMLILCGTPPISSSFIDRYGSSTASGMWKHWICRSAQFKSNGSSYLHFSHFWHVDLCGAGLQYAENPDILDIICQSL